MAHTGLPVDCGTVGPYRLIWLLALAQLGQFSSAFELSRLTRLSLLNHQV